MMTFNEAKESVKHLTGCKYENSNILINECMCDCYEYHFYKAGLNSKSKSKGDENE